MAETMPENLTDPQVTWTPLEPAVSARMKREAKVLHPLNHLSILNDLPFVHPNKKTKGNPGMEHHGTWWALPYVGNVGDTYLYGATRSTSV